MDSQKVSPGLLGFPRELQEAIIAHTTIDDSCVHLARTCKHFHKVATPYIFRWIVISERPDKGHEDYPAWPRSRSYRALGIRVDWPHLIGLTMLLSDRPDLAKHVRELKVIGTHYMDYTNSEDFYRSTTIKFGIIDSAMVKDKVEA